MMFGGGTSESQRLVIGVGYTWQVEVAAKRLWQLSPQETKLS